MKTVAVVPMKLNNERLPNKNIKQFDNGKPLCHYILNTLLKVKGIDEVYVYCSNPYIQRYIPSEIKYLKRNECLDTSTTKMNEVLKAFSCDVDADLYLMSHVTSPFISFESIQQALDKVKTGEYDSALSVQKVQEFLWKDRKPINYDLANIPRTQDLPKIYSETSGFYIFKKEIIQKYNRRVGFTPYLQLVSKIESVDIDELDDFIIANAIYNYILAKEGDLK